MTTSRYQLPELLRVRYVLKSCLENLGKTGTGLSQSEAYRTLVIVEKIVNARDLPKRDMQNLSRQLQNLEFGDGGELSVQDIKKIRHILKPAARALAQINRLPVNPRRGSHSTAPHSSRDSVFTADDGPASAPDDDGDSAIGFLPTIGRRPIMGGASETDSARSSSRSQSKSSRSNSKASGFKGFDRKGPRRGR